MKILQLIQKKQLRGAEIFTCQLSNHLQNCSEVIIVSLFPGYANMPFEGDVIELNRPISKRFRDFQGWKKLAELITKEKPDLVQANAGDTLKFAVLSKLVYKWKMPIIFRNANKMGDFIDSKPKYILNKFFVNKVDFIVSVSNLCEKDLKNTFSLPAHKIMTIPIGVEDKEVIGGPPTDLQHIFDKYKVLVNVGSLVPEKNHEALLRIFEMVSLKESDSFLIIIGDGLLRQQLEKMARGMACKERIIFTGYRNDVLKILKHSRAFLMPSLIEGLPGVILEAMYCKTPVIANNVGGVSEVVNESTGWLVQVGEEANFVNCVLEAIANSSAVEMKVESAFRLLKEKYMNSKIAKDFIKVYKKVVCD